MQDLGLRCPSIFMFGYHGFAVVVLTNTKKLPTLALLPNLYSHIFAVYFFLLHMMLVNVKLDISGYQLVSFILNSTAKTKLAILAFLYCVVFVKTSSVPLKTRSNTFIVKY